MNPKPRDEREEFKAEFSSQTRGPRRPQCLRGLGGICEVQRIVRERACEGYHSAFRWDFREAPNFPCARIRPHDSRVLLLVRRRSPNTVDTKKNKKKNVYDLRTSKCFLGSRSDFGGFQTP